MPYLGNAPSATFQSVAYQDLTGGTGTSFTLNHAVSSAQELEVFVNNVRQEPTVAYTAVGTALTMTGTIAATDDFYVVFQGKAVGSVSHPTTSPLVATTGTFSGAVTATSFSGDGSALTGVSAGKILQVVSTEKTDQFTTTSTSFVDVTGMSASITPSSTSNKILVFFTVGLVGNSSSGQFSYAKLVRDSTDISIGDAAGTTGRLRTGTGTGGDQTYENGPLTIHVLDSPSTTSATTYKIQFRTQSSGTAKFNSRGDDADNAVYGRTSASLTLMEIEG